MSATYVPSSSGNYAVIIHTFDGCSDTSSCINFILSDTEEQLSTMVKYFPNPTTGQLNVDLGGFYENVELTIISVDGKKMSSHLYENIEQIELDNLNLASGLYFVKIQTEKGNYVFKVMKE